MRIFYIAAMVSLLQISASPSSNFQAILLGLCVFLAVALAVVTTAFVVRFKALREPREKLLDAIHKGRGGDYSQRVDYHKENGMGEICLAFNLLMDNIQENHRKVLLNEERYRLVAEQSQNIIYEYTFADDTCRFYSSAWKRLFGRPMEIPGFSKALETSEIIDTQDRQILTDVLGRFERGESFQRAEVRMKKTDGSWYWCSVRASVILTRQGAAERIVGRIEDIDRQKQENERLRIKAQKDLLSGLYNRETTQLLVDKFLENNGENGFHALIAIDIDNFKQINDTKGHLLGDQVISTFGEKLFAQFRNSDIVGRVGGDEFAVLMKNISQDQLERKASDLLQALHFSLEEDRETYTSCSIGIACYPQDGQDYVHLFQAADQVLYCAKRAGKNSYVLTDAGHLSFPAP